MISPPVAHREPHFLARDGRSSFGSREASLGRAGWGSEGGGPGRMCVALSRTWGPGSRLMEMHQEGERPVPPGGGRPFVSRGAGPVVPAKAGWAG